MKDKQFEEIGEKLNRIIVLLTIKNVENKNDKIYSLKKLNLTSDEIGNFIGMTGTGVRNTEGWKRK